MEAASFQIESEVAIDEGAGDKFVVRWNPDDSHIAAACNDGSVKIYASSNGAFIRSLKYRQFGDPIPITSIRWRVGHISAKNKNILLSTTADGTVMHWHATTGKILSSFQLEDNQVHCSDYNYDGRLFAIGCKDSHVRIYDESTRNQVAELLPGRGNKLGHNNRVFAVKWVNENNIVTGGWDNNVILWDIRVCDAIRGCYGPRIYADSLDVYGGRILTGSCDIHNHVQLWSTADCSNLFSRDLVGEDGMSCMAYAAQFSKDGKMFVVAGGGSNRAYLFNAETCEQVNEFAHMNRAIYSVDFANTSNRLVVGSGNGLVKIFEFPQEHAPI